jgi:hypothetical protein
MVARGEIVSAVQCSQSMICVSLFLPHENQCIETKRIYDYSPLRVHVHVDPGIKALQSHQSRDT